MRERIFTFLICLTLLCSLCIQVQAAEGNMDGTGGGGLEGTTGDSGWNDGNEGVRVSVVQKDTKRVVGQITDWVSITPPYGVVSFTKRNKLQYLSGAMLTPTLGAYVYKNPVVPLPNVVSADGTSNIATLKTYFTDEGRIRAIAEYSGISYDTLISGKFTVLIEPLAIIRYHGTRYALTATEAALYDRQVHGDLREEVGFLSHQNLPLAMYLEVGELEIPAIGGAGPQSNDSIIAYLGVGTVNFHEGDQPPPGETVAPPPPAPAFDLEYRADTEVITTIRVSTGSKIDPRSPGEATFGLPTGNVRVEYVVPQNESQLVWVKWRTPDVDADTVFDVPIGISRGTGPNRLRIKVTVLEEDTPPDPQGRDRNDGFRLRAAPTEAKTDTLTWGEWIPKWNKKKKRYDFSWKSYTASLTVSASTMPDERVPTANGNTIKSGYGINAQVNVRTSTTASGANVTPVQHVIATFPEFDFETYNRFLEPGNDIPRAISVWEFRENEYSQFKNRVHFTPLWYPDSTRFPVSFVVLDAWTPAGQLQHVVTADDVMIEGNAYDDWHVAPGYGGR